MGTGNMEFDNVQIDVTFSQASGRDNITSAENIALSFGKLSKWYEALVPEGGSSGQILGWNSSGTAKWINSAASTDEKVKVDNFVSTTVTDYLLTGAVASMATTAAHLVVDNADGVASARMRLQKGTTDTIGQSMLMLGNNIASGTSNNMQGMILMYSSSNKYGKIVSESLTDDRTWMLPDKTGTIAMTSDIPTVNNGKLTIKGETTSVAEFTANQSSDTNFSIIAGSNVTVTPDATNSKITIASSDTKVTSSANHYAPATVSGQDKSASASGATAAWSIDVVKGVTLNTDGKGHITGISVTSGKIPANPNTDRYVNSAAFTDDSTNTAASPVKMTLTRAGSDSATIVGNIPKVSSSSAGVAPKGAAVSTQSQSTKFLREDGSWAAPSYTSIPSNNVTGSGTSGYLTKWNGTNTITNGPQLGSSTTTFLRNDGSWATPTDTKVTQSQTTTANYRPILFGAKNSTDVSTLADTITDGAFTSTKMYAQPSTGLIFCTGRQIENVVIQTGSTKIEHITLQTLMTWLITTKTYIPSGKNCHVIITTSWAYANNDILQVSIDGTNYEIQLAGVIIEFIGNATSYNAGMFRLLIHSSPTTSFTPASGYTTFPVSTIAEYTCNGSDYSPTWKKIWNSHPTYTSKSSGLYKITVDGTGHVSAATAVAKGDITALGIPGSDTNTTYAFATGDAVGQFKVTPSGGTATNYNVNGIAAGTTSGTAKHLAYYSSATSIVSSGNLMYSVENSTASTPRSRTILHLVGNQTTGNDASALISGTKGVLSYGDGGPQINFSTSATIGGGQDSSIIWTDNDAAGYGASWHFVSNQPDWTVVSKRFHARTAISIGTDVPQVVSSTTATNYPENLYVAGTSKFTNSAFGPIHIVRSGSTYAAGIKFSNSSGLIGAIGMTGNVDTALIRWKSDLSTSYTILDTGNTSVTTSGSGNAITALSFSNGTFTATKGSTFSLSTHTHNYAGSSSAGGAATSADALNLTHGNELNFSKLASTGHVWIGYRWNTQGTETSGGTTITTYKFGNANGAGGLAGLEASSSTFKSGTFGDQLIVERTTAGSMASITFKNPSGILGYISANTVDGDLYHYGASDTSTMKYVILDSHNYSSYALASTTKYAGSSSVGGAATNANNIYVTLTNPSGEKTYYTPFFETCSSANKALLTNNGFSYVTKEGTADALGYGVVTVGNGTASGTAGNKRGFVRFYSENTYYAQVYPAALSANRNIQLPDKAGTIALTSDLTVYYSSTTSRTANTVLAAPNGSAGAATFRKLVAADIPALSYVPNTNAGVNAAINLLTTGSSDPTLADYYVAQYAGGGTTTTTYHRRPISALWNTFKGLITLETTGTGNAVTAVSIANDGDNNRKITVTKGSTFSLSTHTHNYAGSSSAGGAANSSNVLNSNTRMDYGWNGVNYFNISGTAGNAAKVNDTPTTAWWHIMRFNHNNNSGYYTDLAIPFNATSLYYKRITSGSVQNGGWVKVLDALNVGYVMSSVIKYDSHARSFTSSKTDSAWNAQAYSNTGYADNVYVSFRPGQTTMYAMIGLDANPSEDANYNKIDYCWYIQNNGALSVYESGTSVTITGHTTYASGDEFRVEYSCGEIRYYHNGTMCRAVTRAVSGKLFFDSSFHNAGNVYDFSYGTSTHSTHTAQIITSTYKSSTYVASLTSSVITLSDQASSFGGWICGPTKNGRIVISSYQGDNDKLYFGYGERGRTTNSYVKAMTWDGPTNTLTADHFVGALQGTASSATTATDATNAYTAVTDGTTTATNYGILFAANPTASQYLTIRKTNNFRINLKAAAAGSEGTAELVLGNNKAISAANNESGVISLYSAGGSYHTIKTNSVTSATTHMLPTKGGTLFNTGNLGIATTAVVLGQLGFSRSNSGLYYSASVDVSSLVTKIFAVSIYDFSSVKNISVQIHALDDTHLWVLVADATQTASTITVGGTLNVRIFGILK